MSQTFTLLLLYSLLLGMGYALPCVTPITSSTKTTTSLGRTSCTSSPQSTTPCSTSTTSTTTSSTSSIICSTSSSTTSVSKTSCTSSSQSTTPCSTSTTTITTSSTSSIICTTTSTSSVISTSTISNKCTKISTSSISKSTSTIPLAIPQGALPPSQDPWYTPRIGFETKLPGTILDSRPILGNVKKVMESNYVSKAYQIMFATTDSQYKPTWAVTTLLVPTASNPKMLCSYQVPYDTANIDGSPSYGIYLGGSMTSQIKSLWHLMLLEGWFVNIPDYEGPLASFAAGVMSGHAVIDSVRASSTFAKESPKLAANERLAANESLGLWGYSGGAFASEWAAELQASYAPNMTIAGVILGGLTPNMTSVLKKIETTEYRGLIPVAMVGIGSQYPNVRQEIVARLKTTGEYAANKFLNVTNMTYDDVMKDFQNLTISDYFVGGLDAVMALPSVKRVIWRDGIMGHVNIPEMPMYIYQATEDQVSDIADTYKLYNQYCEMGAKIEMHENNNPCVKHSDEGVNVVVNGKAFWWLIQLANKQSPIPSNCTKFVDYYPAAED